MDGQWEAHHELMLEQEWLIAHGQFEDAQPCRDGIPDQFLTGPQSPANDCTQEGLDMGFIAADSGGGNFKRVPPGLHIGRCFSLIDLGTQTTVGQFGEKQQHKIRIGWELFGEDEDGKPLTMEVEGKTVPMTISKSYTVSLHEKAALRKDLASWRGRDFTEEEAKAFDVSKLIGAYCMINATTSETNGKTYTNVASITPLPSALKNAKPAPVHPTITFDLDEPDLKVFATFHEKLQQAIQKSPEWIRQFSASTPANEAAPAGAFQDDDIPF